MGLTLLTLSGIDRTSLVQPKTLRITDELNGRNTLEMKLVDLTGVTYRPIVGEPIVAQWDGVTVFAGTLDDISEEQVNNLATCWYTVRAVDWNQRADMNLVAAEYINQTQLAIVQDIVANALADDGIMVDSAMEIGPTIEHVVFNYRTAAEAFNDLGELTGFTWFIDYNKILHFFSRAYFLAPFDLTSDSLYRSLISQQTREQYRNTQWIRAGKDISSVLTESFHGDSKQTTFNVALPIALVPTITLNAAPQTVGIRNVDTSGFQWYWNADDTGVSQDSSGTPISSTDTLTVVYQGFFPILVQSYTQSAIEERASIEGGSGIYEAIDDHQEINRSALAMDYAIGLLRRYGHIPRQLDIETDQPGLKAGQLMQITLPRFNLDGQYLLQRVEMEDLTGTKLRYRLSALDGEPFGTWQEFFKKLSSSKPFVLRENEVLMLLRTFYETINDAEVFSVASTAHACGQVGDVINFTEVCRS
jgi:hypothetical protein